MTVRTWMGTALAALLILPALAGVGVAHSQAMDEAAASTVVNHAWDGAPGFDGPEANVPEGHRLVTLDVTARGSDIYEDPDDITFLLDGETASEYAFWEIVYLTPDGRFYSWDESSPDAARDAISRVLLIVPVPKTTRVLNLSYDGETPALSKAVNFRPVDGGFPKLPSRSDE